MNFADEPYVRVYKRRTTTMAVVGWQARAVLRELFLAVDRAGVLDLDDEDAVDAVAAVLVDVPRDVIESSLAVLVRKGCVQIVGQCLVIPRFREAQEVAASDRLRAQESRARRRSDAMNGIDGVTNCDAPVTKRDEVSRCDHLSGRPSLSAEQCIAEQSNAEQSESQTRAPEEPKDPMCPEPRPEHRMPKLSTGSRRFAESLETEAPDQLEFTAEHRAFEANGIVLSDTWLECRDYRRARKERREDWTAEFTSWLRREAKYRRDGKPRPKGVKAPRQPNGGGFGAEFCAAAGGKQQQ